MRPRTLWILGLVAPLAALATVTPGPPAADPAALRLDGVVARLRADVAWLAADDRGGRDVGSPHVMAAEDFIAARFRAAGLEPLPGLTDVLAPFELERDGVDRACTGVRITTGGASLALVPEAEFRPFEFSDEASVEGEVVFAGYGITSAEHAWDDYEGLDVEGKIALVLRHEPREMDASSPFGGLDSTPHAAFAEKGANARRHGAAGLLIVTDPLHHEPGDDLRWGGGLRLPRPATGATPPPAAARPAPAPAAAPSSAATPGGAATPAGASEPAAATGPLVAMQIARPVAEALVRATGISLTAMQVALDEGARPASFGSLAARASLSYARRDVPEVVPARNVVGVLPGSDPVLKDEWIVVGAHHDHVGMYETTGDGIFNGADDNASGTSAVLELARRFAASPDRPRRTLVFATFSAEEKGLLGSRHLVNEGILPREKLVFMLNNDMLGRNEDKPVEVHGDGHAHGLRAMVEAATAGLGLNLEYAGKTYFGASDHDPFYQKEVPFLFFFTGTHEDYHRQGDHAEKLDYPRMARLVEAEERLLRALANAPATPGFVHHVPWLGIAARVDVDDAGLRRALVAEVEEASRAAQAGLAAGDVLTAFGGVPLQEPAGVGQAFKGIEPGSTATLVVERGGAPVEIVVARPKPGWIGMFPGSVEAEDRKRLGLHDEEGLSVRGLPPDGPAAKAGLQAGDILLTLAGQSINPRQLSGRLAQIGAGETVKATVLRGNERLEVAITLGERPQR